MGTLTINTTAEQDTRIVEAFGKYLNTMDMTDPNNPVARDATGAEVRLSVVNFLKGIVFDQERKAAQTAIVVADLEPT